MRGANDTNATIRVAANEDQWTEGGTGAKSYHFIYVYNVQVYEPLIYLGSDYTLKPGLATRWELQPDGKTWRFFLRQGFTVLRRRDLLIGDVPIHNYAMEKRWPLGSR